MAVELDNLHHMPTIKLAMTPFPFFVQIDERYGGGEPLRLRDVIENPFF